MNFRKNTLYKRSELHEKYGGREQYGISNCPKHPIIFIFSNPKEKQDVYIDKWEDDYFYYSGEGRKGDMKFTGGNKSILNHELDKKHIFLFNNSKKSGYWKYIDELKLVDFRYYKNKDDDGKERNGIQFKLLSVSKDVSSSDESEKEEITKYNYNTPTVTERKGLVTSRVGQGTYRKRVIEKWNRKCSVTGVGLIKILISSHIVPWRESNNHERCDPDNGLLLSPNLDGLFDRNLISFSNSGSIIISDTISNSDLDSLGINKEMKLRFVNSGMKKYLKRHRENLI